MSEKLNGIDVFVEAAQVGSFSLAASRLHLTRSAVAKIIARLEQRLNSRLFHRTTRTQSLTEEGQAFYEHCLRALAELDAGKAVLNSGRLEPTGKLRVSAPVQFGRHCVAPALIKLTKQYPLLNIEMSFNDRFVDIVDEGFDLAIRVGKLSDSSSLASRRLGPQRMAICAAPAYLAEHGRPETLRDLDQHTGVIYGRGGMRKNWIVKNSDGSFEQIENPCRIVLDDLQAIADAALSGAGIAWLPYWMVSEHLRHGDLELVFDSGDIGADIHLVWPYSRHLPAKTRTAIDTLASELPLYLAESGQVPHHRPSTPLSAQEQARNAAQESVS